MFELKTKIARDAQTDLDDTANTKFALTGLGYYDDTETGLSPYADDQLFQSVQAFQEDNDLKKDGIINPEGPTHTKIKEKLSKDKNAENALNDFMRNRADLRIVQKTFKGNSQDLDGVDKYFYCKANFEAAKRGWAGQAAASFLSGAREVITSPKSVIQNGFINMTKDAILDHKANRYGRNAAVQGQYKSAQEACSIFRPDGLDEKY